MKKYIRWFLYGMAIYGMILLPIFAYEVATIETSLLGYICYVAGLKLID